MLASFGSRSPVSFAATGVGLLFAVPAVLGVLLVGPERAGAQELGTRCTLIPQQLRSLDSREPVPGRRVTFIGGAALQCPDGVRIRADSAVVYEETGRNELIGNVRFDSADRTLLAALADYYEREGRLFARGNVRFTEAERGIELTGDTLTYLEITPTRIEEQVTVYGGRPRAVIPGPGGGDEPYVIVSDRIHIEGERFFWAYGDVEMNRDSLEAASDTLAFDQTDNRLILTGSAWMQQGATRVEGGVVNVSFLDEVLREIRAMRDGRLVDGDMDLAGWEVIVTMGEDETPRSVVASSGGPDGEGEELRMAEARTEDLFLQSETINIELPDGVLQEIVATGQALAETSRGELVEMDSTAIEEGFPDRDWVRAQVITITFSPVEPAPVDPDAPAQVDEDESAEAERTYIVEGIDAVGSARTLYRTPPDGVEGPIPIREWSISYILADRILIVMRDGEVSEVQAEGQVEGLQLEPTQSAGAGSGPPAPNGDERRDDGGQ